MKAGEREIEIAELRVEQERECGVARIRARLDAAGQDDCTDCGEQIDAARRAALPSAVRCMRCQGIFERARRSVPGSRR